MDSSSPVNCRSVRRRTPRKAPSTLSGNNTDVPDTNVKIPISCQSESKSAQSKPGMASLPGQSESKSVDLICSQSETKSAMNIISGKSESGMVALSSQSDSKPSTNPVSSPSESRPGVQPISSQSELNPGINTNSCQKSKIEDYKAVPAEICNEKHLSTEEDKQRIVEMNMDVQKQKTNILKDQATDKDGIGLPEKLVSSNGEMRGGQRDLNNNESYHSERTESLNSRIINNRQDRQPIQVHQNVEDKIQNCCTSETIENEHVYDKESKEEIQKYNVQRGEIMDTVDNNPALQKEMMAQEVDRIGNETETHSEHKDDKKVTQIQENLDQNRETQHTKKMSPTLQNEMKVQKVDSIGEKNNTHGDVQNKQMEEISIESKQIRETDKLPTNNIQCSTQLEQKRVESMQEDSNKSFTEAELLQNRDEASLVAAQLMTSLADGNISLPDDLIDYQCRPNLPQKFNCEEGFVPNVRYRTDPTYQDLSGICNQPVLENQHGSCTHAVTGNSQESSPLDLYSPLVGENGNRTSHQDVCNPLAAERRHSSSHDLHSHHDICTQPIAENCNGPSHLDPRTQNITVNCSGPSHFDPCTQNIAENCNGSSNLDLCTQQPVENSSRSRHDVIIPLPNSQSGSYLPMNLSSDWISNRPVHPSQSNENWHRHEPSFVPDQPAILTQPPLSKGPSLYDCRMQNAQNLSQNMFPQIGAPQMPSFQEHIGGAIQTITPTRHAVYNSSHLSEVSTPFLPNPELPVDYCMVPSHPSIHPVSPGSDSNGLGKSWYPHYSGNDTDPDAPVPKRRRRSKISKNKPEHEYLEIVKNLVYNPSYTMEDMYPKGRNKGGYFWMVSPDINQSEVRSIDHKGLIAKYIDYLLIENEHITEMSKSVSIPIENCVMDDPYLMDIVRVKIPFPTPKYLHWLRSYYPNIQVDWPAIRKELASYNASGDGKRKHTYFLDNRPCHVLLGESFYFFQREKDKLKPK